MRSLNKFIDKLWPSLQKHIITLLRKDEGLLAEKIIAAVKNNRNKAPCLKNVKDHDGPDVADSELSFDLHLTCENDSQIDSNFDVGGRTFQILGLQNFMDVNLRIKIDLKSWKIISIEFLKEPVRQVEDNDMRSLNKFIGKFWPKVKKHSITPFLMKEGLLVEKVIAIVENNVKKAPCLKNVKVHDGPDIADSELLIDLHLAWGNDSQMDSNFDFDGETLQILGLQNFMDVNLRIKIDLKSLKEVSIEVLNEPVYYPDEEEEEWLNTLVKRIWRFINKTCKPLLKKQLQELLIKSAPTYLNVDLVDMGEKVPWIHNIKIQDEDDDNQHDQIVIDMAVIYKGQCDVRVSTFLGIIFAEINDVSLAGRLRIELKPLVDQIPFFGGVSFAFIEEPILTYNLEGLASLLSWLVRPVYSFKSKISKEINATLVLPAKQSLTLFPDRLICKYCKTPVADLGHLQHIPSQTCLKVTDKSLGLLEQKTVTVQRIKNQYDEEFNVVTFSKSTASVSNQVHRKSISFKDYIYQNGYCPTCEQYIGGRLRRKLQRTDAQVHIFFCLLIDSLEEACAA